MALPQRAVPHRARVARALAPRPADPRIIRQRVRFFPTKLVALTFDDGPDPVNTPRILKALAQRHAHATFFVEGVYAQRHPELLKQIVAGGNVIGNHTFSHPARCTEAQACAELQRTAQIIEKATGKRPTLYRPPYGITRGTLMQTALREGYTAVLWTISSADTVRHMTAATIAHNVTHTPNPGDIVIMHDGPGHGETASAVPEILDEVGKLGFRFVTIPELIQAWHAFKPAPKSVASRKRSA